jgi:SAM-dependent methyltransferase
MDTTSRDSRFWDRIAPKYAADPIADMVGYERTLETTRAALGNDMAVYEFGCGTGTTALMLAPAVGHITATDISQNMISIAREKAKAQGIRNVSFEVGTPEKAPYPNERFEIVLGFNVLHLMAARAEALQAVHRVLKPGGLFISKTPCLTEMGIFVRLAIPLAQAIGQAPSVAFFSEQELVREIEAAGFTIVENARHGAKAKDMRCFLVARKAGK